MLYSVRSCTLLNMFCSYFIGFMKTSLTFHYIDDVYSTYKI